MLSIASDCFTCILTPTSVVGNSNGNSRIKLVNHANVNCNMLYGIVNEEMGGWGRRGWYHIPVGSFYPRIE